MENSHGKTAHLECHNAIFGQKWKFLKILKFWKIVENQFWHHQNDQKNTRNWFPLVPGAETLKNEEKQAKKKSEKN